MATAPRGLGLELGSRQAINDNHGHAVGYDVLRIVASMMASLGRA